MPVGRDPLAQRLFAHLGRPGLRIGDEEALVAGEPVDHRCFLAAERGVIRIVGRLKTGEIGDVLTQRQFALHVEAGERFVRVVLLGQCQPSFLELLAVGIGPPVAHRAGGIEFRTVIVEAVADLVADNGPDRAVVIGRVCLGVEERRLEDGGGEVQRVLHRQVDRVDQLRVHPPFALVERFAHLGKLLLVAQLFGRLDIGIGVVRVDLQRVVIGPFVGITDADFHGLDLLFGFGLGRGRHPVDCINAFGKGVLDIVDHPLDFGLGRGGEVLIDIELA